MKLSDLINKSNLNYLNEFSDEKIENIFSEWKYYSGFNQNGIIACGWFENDDILIISADGIFVYDIRKREVSYEDYEESFQKNISKDNLNYYFMKRAETLPVFGLRGGNGNLLTLNNVWKLDIVSLSFYQKIPKLINYRKKESAFLQLKQPKYEDKLFLGFSKSEDFFLIMGNNGLDVYRYSGNADRVSD